MRPTSLLRTLLALQNTIVTGFEFTAESLIVDVKPTYLAQRNDKTTVTKLMRIAWETVGKIIQRVVRRQRGDVDRLDGLRTIGVDELSYRRHHEYVTVVVDHDTGTH